jgi:hypothetical protein
MRFLLLVALAFGSCTTHFKGARVFTADDHCLVLSDVVISIRSRLDSDSDGPVGGGAIYLSSPASRFQISDSAFCGCSAHGAQVYGGACWLFSGAVSFARTCASDCSSSGCGHFVALAGDPGTFRSPREPEGSR